MPTFEKQPIKRWIHELTRNRQSKDTISFFWETGCDEHA